MARSGDIRESNADRTAIGWSLLAIALFLTSTVALPCRARAADPSDAIATITTSELSALIASPDPPLIFDVRERDEFRVSRIAGAVSAPASAPYADFLARHGIGVRGRVVVFYCAIGMRSLDYALGLEDELARLGADAVLALKDGLFVWHGERRPLVDDVGPTDWIHPVDERLRRLLLRPERAVPIQR
jgi:rhodanese-related sulfurtransferase